MRILYIASEHVSGTLSLFQNEHRRRGDECRFVTFWHSRWDFPDDICLQLPLMPDRKWVRSLRETFRSLRSTKDIARQEMPYWRPSALERNLFHWRDAILWPKIKRAIQRYDLNTFDVIHLDGGLDFTRDARFARRAAQEGRRIVCFYHGSDLRTRGIIPAVDEITGLRITSEWDLLEYDPRLRYLFLPFDTSQFTERVYRFHNPIRIGHASRNPYKGTPAVLSAVEALKQSHAIEFIWIKDLPYHEALQRKYDCDIFVDQLTNAGGWGYGMSSVEALAMGIPVVTNIPAAMAHRLGNHPFVIASTESITDTLRRLLADETECRRLSRIGREWVRQFHDVRRVGDALYGYYRQCGWLS